jgi:hypothetical protein
MAREQIREILQKEFDKLQTPFERYSINKFSKKAGVSAGTMWELLHEPREWKLSDSRALEIIDRVCDDEETRNKARLALGAAPVVSKENLSADDQAFMLEPKKLAAVMALDLKQPGSVERIASRLEMDAGEVLEVFEKCRSQGLLEIDEQGDYRRTKKFWVWPDNIPNATLRGHQIKNIEIVKQAISDVPVEARDCSSMTFVGSKAKIEAVRKELRAVYERINTIMSEEDANDEVYLLALSLVPLTRTEEGRV